MTAPFYLLLGSDIRDVVRAILGLKTGKGITLAHHVVVGWVTHFKLTFCVFEPPQTFSDGRALKRVRCVHKIVSQDSFLWQIIHVVLTRDHTRGFVCLRSSRAVSQLGLIHPLVSALNSHYPTQSRGLTPKVILAGLSLSKPVLKVSDALLKSQRHGP